MNSNSNEIGSLTNFMTIGPCQHVLKVKLDGGRSYSRVYLGLRFQDLVRPNFVITWSKVEENCLYGVNKA